MGNPLVPINVPPSLYWDGIDGSWSTFHVQVGTPGQTVRLLPGSSASASDTTWVVRPEGCRQANPNLTDCDESRGLLFDPDKSTSWTTERLDNNGLFELNTYYEGFLNLTGNAYYGFDTLTLGLPGSGLPPLERQIIAGIATNNYWLGTLGLSPIPFNFTSQNDSTSMRDPQPSYLSELKNQSQIPSLSWGYTAGASYRDDPTFGSLVLGGYDTSRFEANNVSFAFAADFSRDLTVYLQSVSYDTLGSSPLLTKSIPVFINSLVTHLWLPIEVCERFETAFNLTWNDTAQLYLIDDETHSRLSSLNPSLTFTIGHADSDGDRVDISMPYDAFDLSGKPPFVEPPVEIFPSKARRKSRPVHAWPSVPPRRALFPDASRKSNTTIVAIEPPGEEKSSGPGVGTIAGAVVGVVVGLLLFAAAIFWLMRRRKLKRDSTSEMGGRAHLSSHTGKELDGQEPQVHELEHTRLKGSELDGVHTSLLELDPQAERKAELAEERRSLDRHELP